MPHHVLLAFVVGCSFPSAALTQTFTEVPNAYSRVVSPHAVARQALYDNGVLVPDMVPLVPLKPGGQPGISMIDYDTDGDIDLFVPNGPGVAHSLFDNDGYGNFTDVAETAGVAAFEHDGGGTCFGDLDNDGDPELLVLGIATESHILYRNDGASFADITDSTGLAGAGFGATSCTMGDLDGDGFLDIYVGNTYEDWSTHIPVFVHQPEVNRHNQLYMNRGDLSFVEEASVRGLHDTAGFRNENAPPGANDGDATVTWAVAAVDIDGDGDIDILQADDQGPAAPAAAGGVDRGFVRVFLNDGTTHFTDMTSVNGLDVSGAWMGLAFGDFNHDGTLDFFASNAGDYMFPFMGMPYTVGGMTSRWFLGAGAGYFIDPGVGALVATPFGFGANAWDVDNDGDTDLAYFGGLDVTVAVVRDNPGVVFANDGTGLMSYQTGVLSPNHSARNTMGSAVGDLNGDGCDDIVTASNGDSAVLVPMGPAHGGPFDAAALFIPTMMPGPGEDPTTPPTFMVKTPGVDLLPGTLSIELNSCDTGNGSVSARTMGTVGITRLGSVNRIWTPPVCQGGFCLFRRISRARDSAREFKFEFLSCFAEFHLSFHLSR